MKIRSYIAALQLLFVGWLAYGIGKEPAYQDFLGQLRLYINTGQVDTSWVKKYI